MARPLTAADQVSEEVVTANERRLGVRLPETLRTSYTLAGNMGQLNSAYNHLLPPAQWKIARRVLVFLSENQGVVKWGVAASRAHRIDAAVFSPPTKGGANTRPGRRGLDCSDFLVLMLCWQAVHGGMPHTGWAQIGSEVSEAIASRWGTAWRSRDLRAWYRPGQALCLAGPSSANTFGGRVDLLVGGHSKSEFEAVREELVALGVALELP